MNKLFSGIYVSVVICSLTCPEVFAGLGEARQYNEEGIKYMEAKDYKKAVDAFSEAYSRMPKNDVVKNNLANAYYSLAGDYTQRQSWISAADCAQKACELNSTPEMKKDVSVLYSNIGYGQMQKGLPDSAYRMLKQAIKYNESNWAAYVNLGRLMYDQGKIDEAIKYWSRAVALNPQLTDIKEQLARLKNENAVEDKFRSKSYGHFEIKYEGYEKEDLASRVVDILNDAYKKLGYDFQYYPQQKVPVIIYTKEQFQKMTDTPDWIGGLFDGIVRVSASDIKREKDWLERVLYHEYTHVILYRKVGPDMPVWLNEGLAQIKEPKGESLESGDVTFLNKQIEKGSFMKLADLDKAFSDRNNQDRLRLAYLEAKLMLKYLKERYDFYRIRYIIDKLAVGKTIDAAIKEILFIDTSKLEQNWRDWIKEKYK